MAKLIELTDEYKAIFETSLTKFSEKVGKLKLRVGDVVGCPWIENYGYRNEGLYFWDGEKIIDFYFEEDDYGSIPPQFSFPTFPFGYFSEVIAHNNINWLSPEYVTQAIETFQIAKISGSNRLIRVSSITDANGKTYPILIDLEETELKLQDITKEWFQRYFQEIPAVIYGNDDYPKDSLVLSIRADR